MEKENHAPLTTLSLFDIRHFISTATTSLDTYPHNSISLYLIPPVIVSSLHSTPLSTLALASRRALIDSRSLPALQEALDWTHRTLPIPARKSGTEGIFITNQIAARLTRTSWGAPSEAVRGFWMRTMPKVRSFSLRVKLVCLRVNFKGGPCHLPQRAPFRLDYNGMHEAERVEVGGERAGQAEGDVVISISAGGVS